MTKMAKSKNKTVEEIILNVNARFIAGFPGQNKISPRYFCTYLHFNFQNYFVSW